MGLFGKKKDKKQTNKKSKNYKDNIKDQEIIVDSIEEEIIKDGKEEIKVKKKVKKKVDTNKNEVLDKGGRDIKDMIAPDIDRSDPGFLKVGGKYVRSFVMKGYPAMVSVGWLDDLLNSESDIDTAIYINPADERQALQELTEKITQYQAQLITEQEKGNISNQTRLQATIEQLYEQRIALEQNYENLFHVQIVSSLYADTSTKLEKETQRLQTRLKGGRKDMSPMYLRQDEAYKSTLPFGESYVKDYSRNLNSGALTACFPFYNSDISHLKGVLVGINLATRTPIYIDFYDRSVLNNSNASVFGESGSGKTFFVSLLTLRSALKQIRTVIIDPEGEYRKLTQAMGGAYIKLAPDSSHGINPFDIEEEFIKQKDGSITSKVDLVEKVSDIESLIGVMARNITMEQRSLTSSIVMDLYRKDFGINEDPASLYEEDFFDPTTQQIVHGKKKEMPTFTDFHNNLLKYVEKEQSETMRQLANSLAMFRKEGVYGLFDRQTSQGLENFADAPIVTFDVSKLEEGVLRPIGMYISMSWTWEKFLKKRPELTKRVVCDEAWMLVNKNMEGHEYTSKFLEVLARRIRKTNGGLVVASQNFKEFAESSSGQAVLHNTVVQIFLKQNSTNIDSVQETFKLSDGERNFLLTSNRGEMLIRMNNEAVIAQAIPFYYEKALIEDPFSVMGDDFDNYEEFD